MALRGRVNDRFFRLGYRRGFLALALVRGCLAGWVFPGTPDAIGIIALAAASEILCARVLACTGPRGHRPVSGFAAHSNTTFWSLPVGAVLFGPAGVAFVTLYEMLAAPRVAPAVRRLQRHAPVATTVAERSTDLSPVAAALLGLAGRWITTPSPWVAQVLLPLAVFGAVLGGVFFGLSLPTHGLVGHDHVGRAALVVAVRAVVLPAPLLVLALQGLSVPAVAWVLVTGLAPVNTVILSRLYGYDTTFATSVLSLSVLASALTTGVVAAGCLINEQ